jgi:predicted  nucleic acid-binding Zn-ribbon protein
MVQSGNVSPVTGEWECAECGYVEEGVQRKRPQECPECGAPGTAFEFFAYDEDDNDEWEIEDEADEDDSLDLDEDEEDDY